jgi:MYXO-CTERM domain-containing protein
MLARDNEIRDELTVRLRNEGPSTPVPQMPIGRVTRECDTLLASAFADGDGDTHGTTHWQVSTRCDDFEDPVLERYRTRENWYGGVDLAAGDDLTDEPLEGLEEGTFYCWRVRYRDRALAWSEWSAPSAFLIDSEGAGVARGCTDPSTLTPPAPDAGPHPPPPAGGCGCRAAPSAGDPTPLALLVAACLLGARRRPR